MLDNEGVTYHWCLCAQRGTGWVDEVVSDTDVEISAPYTFLVYLLYLVSGLSGFISEQICNLCTRGTVSRAR